MKTYTRSLFLVSSLLLAGPSLAEQAAAPAPSAPAAAAAAKDYSVETANSQITYHLVHKFHKVDGVSKSVEGKARILGGGKAQVMVRVPVATFDSGNSNRDSHMKETVAAAQYPVVEIKASSTEVELPTTFPSTLDRTFKCQLSFHGQTKQLDLPVKLLFESAGQVKVSGSLQVSLEEFKVERPSLLTVKVDDALKIDFNVAFKG